MYFGWNHSCVFVDPSLMSSPVENLLNPLIQAFPGGFCHSKGSGVNFRRNAKHHLAGSCLQGPPACGSTVRYVVIDSSLKILPQFLYGLSVKSNAVSDPYDFSHKNVISFIKFYSGRIAFVGHYVLHSSGWKSFPKALILNVFHFITGFRHLLEWATLTKRPPLFTGLPQYLMDYVIGYPISGSTHLIKHIPHRFDYPPFLRLHENAGGTYNPQPIIDLAIFLALRSSIKTKSVFTSDAS